LHKDFYRDIFGDIETLYEDFHGDIFGDRDLVVDIFHLLLKSLKVGDTLSRDNREII
jgi:hypothetical protein